MIYVIDHKDSFTHNVVHQLSLFDEVECDNYNSINDSKLKKAANQSSRNYLAKAPQKSEIFSSGREGEIIRVGCWIGRSVKVPKL